MNDSQDFSYDLKPQLQKQRVLSEPSPYEEPRSGLGILLDKLKPSIWWLVFVLAPLFLYLLINVFSEVVGAVVPHVTGADGQDIRAEFGALGDFFGGMLNPILSFIGLVFLIVTLRQNQQALAQSAEELRMTREELHSAAEAQMDMSQTQKQQLLENAFFTQFERLCLLEQQITDEPLNPRNDGSLKSKRMTYLPSTLNIIQKTYGDLCLASSAVDGKVQGTSTVPRYLLEHAVIAQCSVVLIDAIHLASKLEDKERFFRIIRCSVSDDVSDLLLLSAVFGHREFCSELIQAMELSSFLKGRSFDSLLKVGGEEPNSKWVLGEKLCAKVKASAFGGEYEKKKKIDYVSPLS